MELLDLLSSHILGDVLSLAFFSLGATFTSRCDMLAQREVSVIGVTDNLQGLFDGITRLLSKWLNSDDQLGPCPAFVGTIFKIASTGLLITCLLDSRVNTRKALFA